MDGEPLIEPIRPARTGHLREMGFALIGGSVILGSLAFAAMRLIPDAPVAGAPSVSSFVLNPYDGVELSAASAVVYDLATDEIIFEKSPEAQLPLASLTKLLTVYAGTESMPEDARIAVSAAALGEEGDSGFSEGETFSLAELARAALVASSNDAAGAIAEASENRRALSAHALFAATASVAGLEQTYAYNGTGLDENEAVSGAYGSALDIARLAGALLVRAPDIARASARESVSIASESGTTYLFENTNPDVGRIPGLLLSKTGYTDLAGGNLVIVFDAGVNHPIALVVLGSTREERVADVAKLLDATLAHFSYAS